MILSRLSSHFQSRKYIKPELLPNLLLYKYTGVDRSLLSRYLLGPYWNWLVRLFPLWMAPNLITLIGLVWILAAVAAILYYSPALAAASYPSWVYYLIGMSIWLYSSLDAIDGKQARRTGTSGPLGELFDHGIDAINLFLTCFLMKAVYGISSDWKFVTMFIMTCVVFMVCTWEEYYTHVLYLGYISGPVEGAVLIVLSALLSGVLGPSIWSISVTKAVSISSWNVTLGDCVIALTLVGAFLTVLTSLWRVYQIKSRTSWPIVDLLPFIFYLMATIALIYLRPALWESTTLILFLALFGVGFANAVGRVILAHVTSAPYPQCTIAYAPVVLLAIHALLIQAMPSTNVFNDRVCVILGLIFNVVIHAHFVLKVIGEICQYLEINCLTIRQLSRPTAHPKKSA